MVNILVSIILAVVPNVTAPAVTDITPITSQVTLVSQADTITGGDWK